MVKIKSLFKTNSQRNLEAIEDEIKRLFFLTEGVPGDTLSERISNLLPSKPVVRPGEPPEKIQ